MNRAVGTTPFAWRGDSARVRDTPLIDFILEVERRAADADLASTPAFSLDCVARRRRRSPWPSSRASTRTTTRCVPYASPGRQLRDYLEFSARYFRTFAGDTGRTDAARERARAGVQLRHRVRARTTSSTYHARSARA